MLEDLADKALDFAVKNGAEYCDVRSEGTEGNGVLIENGLAENFSVRSERGMGIRMLVDGSWAFYSASDPTSIDELKPGILESVKNARYLAQLKKRKVRLAESKIFVDNVVSLGIKRPTPEEMAEIALGCDKLIRVRKSVRKSSVSIRHDFYTRYFTSSEGARILQTYEDTVANLSATSHESGLSESVSRTEGGRGGLEMIVGRTDIFETARRVSQNADNLINAKPVKEDKATVVMNPDFVALLVHEILGHPSEADRVLGKEMAWAGGAWWAGKLGARIGSCELDVIDDPSMPYSLGCYKYDDEGVMASRKSLVEGGILVSHMHSRETAYLFDTVSNSSMRSSGFSFMPLIRMACTCIAPGDWEEEEMIKEVQNGYLICDMKVPSIDMMRYNWNISCQYAHKIENGEVKELLRDVIVMGNSPEFFNSISARSDELAIRPITNCGKGDPMQIMRMGNGGPYIRASATVKSVGN